MDLFSNFPITPSIHQKSTPVRKSNTDRRLMTVSTFQANSQPVSQSANQPIDCQTQAIVDAETVPSPAHQRSHADESTINRAHASLTPTYLCTYWQCYQVASHSATHVRTASTFVATVTFPAIRTSQRHVSRVLISSDAGMVLHKPSSSSTSLPTLSLSFSTRMQRQRI